ncbi:ABC-type organic anion transporter ABCA8-like isoform X2 [Pyxicephalus adspersus]|uniref:ABC-type organic anion transporter ABCA8-like isoform X2 n=1 Tax=Pyxicephalus adspersus TaxID=30357 RepID=UPI003B5CF643
MAEKMACSSGIAIREYENEKDIQQDILRGRTVGLVFHNYFKYHIRYSVDDLSSPNDYLAVQGICDNVSVASCTPAEYWISGFLFLQASIDSAIIEINTGKSVMDTMASIKAVRMRSTKYMWRQMVYTCVFISSMCMCYVSLTYLMSQYVSRERHQMREIMKVMKLKDLAFWLSWGLLYAVYVVIIANLMTLVVKQCVFFESSYGVILLLFILYGLASVSFTFMLSAIFRNPRVTAIVGFFITLILSLFGLLLIKNLPKALELLLSIFPPFAFAVGLTESILLENDMQGVFFLDMAGDSSHVLSSCISLSLDIIFYTILTIYFDKVLPDKYGIRHEPFFFMKSSFWRRDKGIQLQSPSVKREDIDCGDHIERVPSYLHGSEAIRIVNIQKTYKERDKKVTALGGLNFDIYEGQITALLGHSGAGKTTLLNILSGICRPTSGSASIYGYNLSDVNHLDEIHRRVGFCPQFDVKFDPLTVKENLKVFANIKGIQAAHVDDEVQKVISDLQLTDIQNLEAGKLSGGQKRKLTLGIALLGDPQVLILDEPTAGLDPCSRHQVWSVLKEKKGNHVILLSTQFMDEADILADRKAVISSGRLKCVGTSLFLKRKWGIGYHLRMEVTPSCDPEIITSLMQQHISNPKISSKKENELTFTLPFHNMDAFPDLFSHLEERIGRDIVSFGVSMTTLEDVFLKLENEADIEQGDYGVFDQEVTGEEDREVLSSEIEDSIQLMADSGNATLTGLALWRQQTLAVARIRFLKLKNNMKSFRAILLLMLLYLIPVIIFFTVMSNLKAIHTWELRPDLYFLRAGDKEHKHYSRLLICNNTGSPIENFTRAVTSQNIIIDVVDGPYDPNITGYRGAIEVSRGKEDYSYTIVGNPRALNALPVLVNIISNSQLRISKSSKHIQVWSDPVLRPSQDAENPMLFAAFVAMAFAAGFAPHFAMSSIEDTKIKARSQLHASGLFPSAYWCGQALVDIPYYWLLMFLMTAILFIFNHRIVLDPWVACVLIFGIIAYGAALILYVYVIAFLLRNSKSHHDWWSFFFIIVSYVLVIFEDLLMRLSSLQSYILPFIFPPTTLPLLLQEIVSTFYIEQITRFSPDDIQNYENLYFILSVSFVHILLFCGMLWCLEWKFGRKSLKRDPVFRTSKRQDPMKRNPEELADADEEVVAEEERVKLARNAGAHEEKPIIIVDSLRKEFKVNSGVFSCKKKRRVATKSLSFCVRKGEILGLLGPNGAGKTTSIFMLAGELKPSAGVFELCDPPHHADESKAFLGYCCQDSPLWPDITVQEHLEIYAAVKGMKKKDRDLAIQRIAKALELKEHLDQAAGKLSTGVSRKVCFAISMLGNPTIVLLDEPSTGLDPKGRQRVWRAIKAAFRNKERGAILTTHYMEEAEAVCDRVAIMVSGKLRCIGSVQQLKSKFGKGYLLAMKMNDSQHGEVLHQKIIQMFPQAARQERFSSLLVYKIPMDDVHSLSQAFLQLEDAKRMYNIEDYSFSQFTLEQVFLDLVKEQEKDDFEVEKAFSWKRLQSESV